MPIKPVPVSEIDLTRARQIVRSLETRREARSAARSGGVTKRIVSHVGQAVSSPPAAACRKRKLTAVNELLTNVVWD
jgi:hypothetical protein